jgi:ribosomal protein L11 methyltransferase
MNYECWHFTVDPPQPGSEILIAILGERGFESFEATEDGFNAFIRSDDAASVTTTDLVFSDFTFAYRKSAIAAVNWNAEWEKNFQPVRIGRRLIIRPPFHKKEDGFEREIVIMPKMSFGTGHHDTTRMMCEVVMEENVSGKRVLDMGCGTGVLAILAAQFGAAEVTGIDNDAWSVENAIENCAQNGFSSITILSGGEEVLKEQRPFDVILANINKNILRKQMAVYADKLVPGGMLALSGFFVSDAAELIQAASGFGFTEDRRKQSGDWCCLVLRKSGSAR